MFTWYRNYCSRLAWHRAHHYWYPILAEFRYWALRMEPHDFPYFVHARYSEPRRIIYTIISNRRWWKDFLG